MKNYQSSNELIQIINAAANPKVIGIDGVTGAGKSFLARRICEVIDQYVVLEFDNFRTHNISNVTSYELNTNDIDLIREVGEVILKKQRKIIFEGVLLLKMVEKIKIPLNLLIFIKSFENRESKNEEIESYLKLYEPFKKASVLYTPNKSGL